MKRVIFILIVLIMMSSAACQNKEEVPRKLDINTQPKVKKIEPPKDEVKEMISTMTLEEKLGQMIIVGFDGTELNDDIRKIVVENHAGGIILFQRNISDKEQLSRLIIELKNTNASNKIPLFISVDQEGGRVSRLPASSKKFPSSRYLGKKDDKSMSYKTGQEIGDALSSFGFNINFAPVLDIFSNPKNTVIGDRSFGSTPEIVSSHGIAVMKGLQSKNIIPVIKHFPGHGDTKVDSHIGLPVVYNDRNRLDNFELIPFKEAINNGADMVMTAHIVFPKIDGDKIPATLSKKILTGILRGDLGFNGVVITDDMEMGAIADNFGVKESVLKAVEAGADVVLISHTYEKQIEALNGLKEAVKNGKISVQRINESVERILRLKKKYNLFT